MKEGRKPEYPEKTPGKSFRKWHILHPEDSTESTEYVVISEATPSEPRTRTIALVAG